ncbi:MAG TPA: cyanophycin synthetase, partial [Solirubrobacteraceae bacterium]|nr:cyanophycin synthetase [Solirubrobacteraceae bacterium]
SLLKHLRAGGTAVVPAGDELIAARVPARLRVATFGPGGDVDALPAGLRVGVPGSRLSAHMRRNALAALAAARAAGLEPRGVVDVALSELRGQRHELPDGTVVVNDCYNANPMSMRAALDDLAASAPGRRVAVLGDMLELGPGERRFHEEIGAHAAACGVELLVAVGPRARAIASGYGGAGEVHEAAGAAAAAALVPGLLRAGDTVLVKASRGMALEAVVAALEPPPRTPAG